MGPRSQSQSCQSRQAGARKPRTRRCLLKGCEQRFRPDHPGVRYCGAGCRAAAREWSEWRAQQRYRQSEKGRERRREQCRRRRARQRKHGESSEPQASEGHHPPRKLEGNPCDRPGCYEGFIPTARSPLQRFCSADCRQALRRVIEREQYWESLRCPGHIAGRHAVPTLDRCT